MAKKAKKSSGLKTILFLAAAVLGLVGFFMVFVNPLLTTVTTTIGSTTNVKEIVSEWQVIFFGTVHNADDSVTKLAAEDYAVGAMIGFFLMLGGFVTGLLSAVLARKNKTLSAVLGVLTAALLIAGGALAFCTKTFMNLEEIPGLDLGGLVKANVKTTMTAGPIVGGLCGCVGGLAALGGAFAK